MMPDDRSVRPGQTQQRRREPVDAHFRHMGQAGVRWADVLGATPCRFEVYRADEVRMTSIQFAGGDWHWRLCDNAGQVLVDAGGYRHEAECRAAIAILKQRA